MKAQTTQNQKLSENSLANAALQTLQLISYFITGIVMSRATVFESYSPFGIAFTAAVPAGTGAMASTLGAVIGYMLPGAPANAMRYVATVFAVAGVRWALSSLGNVTRHSLFPPAAAFLCYVLTGVAISAYSYTTPFMIIMSSAEAFLAAGAAFFISNAISLVGTKRSIGALTGQELTSVVITLGIILMSLSTYTVWGISPGRVFSILVILVAARFGREAAGSIVGISIGIMMSLSNPSMGHLPAAYTFGGLISGIFSALGRVGCSAAFVIAGGIVAVREGATPEVLASLYEIMIATVLFLVIPPKVCERLSRFFSKTSIADADQGIRQSLISRLNFAAKALSEVSESVEVVSSKLGKVCASNISGVYTRSTEEVCRSCGMKMYCWETAYSDTMNSLNDITGILRNKGQLDVKDAPPHFSSRCKRLPELISAINKNYANFTTRKGAQRRIAEVRAVIANQFEGMSNMLYELSGELSAVERFDIAATEKVIDALNSLSLTPYDVSCRLDKYDRMTVEILLPDNVSVNRAKLTNELSCACQRSFDSPAINKARGECRVVLTEKASLSVKIGCAQHACNNNRICGDAYDYFYDGKGRVIMIVSDGMGTGGRAAVDGAMATGLISRLIQSGFSYDCALKIVNSALLCKSGDESLATIDIMCIDLFSGRADFYKAGASPSVVRRSGSTFVVETSSLPAGILNDISFEHVTHTLSEGDIVLLLSDGAISTGLDWIEKELEVFDKGTAQSLSEHIVRQAQRRRMDGHDDDITVLAAIVGKGI